MKKVTVTFFQFCLLIILASDVTLAAEGTQRDSAIDSRMSSEEAFRNLDPQCPLEIKKKQCIVRVRYFSLDGKIHQGQIIVDHRLGRDIKKIFRLALRERFPIESVIPVSDERFWADDKWSDDLSMMANNTSGFNYREKTGGGSLSKHALGWAVDINPKLNPYVKGNTILPEGATYDPHVPGTLNDGHPIVQEFLRLGWIWGGHWETLKDYQHFEKDLNQGREARKILKN